MRVRCTCKSEMTNEKRENHKKERSWCNHEDEWRPQKLSIQLTSNHNLLSVKILLYHWTLKKSLSCQPHHSKASAKTSPAQNSGNGYFHTQRALTCQTHFLPNTFIKFHHQANWLHTMKLQGNRKYCFLGSLGFNCTDKRNIFEMYNSLLKQGEYWEWKWALVVDYARITGANQNYPRDCRTYGH